MTRPEIAVRERLLQIGALTSLVDARVYQLKLPQRATLPAVRLQLIDDVVSYHERGENDLIPSRVQIDAFADERSGVDAYAEAVAVADAIEGDWRPGSPGPPTGLSGWRGDLGGSPPTIRINFARKVDRAPMYEPAPISQEGAQGRVRIRLDYIVWWKKLIA